MFYMHPDLLKRISDMRRADAERQAADWRLARRAGMGRQREWLSSRGHRLLWQVGHWLAMCRSGLDGLLERCGRPRPVSLEGQRGGR
jgi:hypothetical protein